MHLSAKNFNKQTTFISDIWSQSVHHRSLVSTYTWLQFLQHGHFSLVRIFHCNLYPVHDNKTEALIDWLWSPYGIGQTIIFLLHGFFFLFFLSFFSSPNLRVGDWMSAILPHMVWPYCKFKMQVWNVLHAARWKCRTQKIAKKSPSAHHRRNLSGYIFATKAQINNRKKTC